VDRQKKKDAIEQAVRDNGKLTTRKLLQAVPGLADFEEAYALAAELEKEGKLRAAAWRLT
jgi:hypothetical protein